MSELKVLPIPIGEARPWILRKHYAHRMPCVKYSFGAFDGSLCVGIVTYGPTPTPAVQEHICGGAYSEIVLELNRLCVDSQNKNTASFLVGGSMKLLPRPSIIVSYADEGMGHKGYIYQATNFMYTGAVTAHDSEYIVNGKKTHARTLTAQGITNPTEWARINKIETVAPMPKHRYLIIIGSKKQKKEILSKLTYPILQGYPKGDSTRYDASAKVELQENFGFDA